MTTIHELPSGHQVYDTQITIAAGAEAGTNTKAEPLGLAEATPPLFLPFAADVVDDLERVRIANENRLRQLTRTVTDSDGETRGFGLDQTNDDVVRLSAIVDMLAEAEHKAVLNLQRAMRQHPLGPWVKATKGIGEKQAARLLASIGDPYWNDLHNRPRLVSELWQYCGHGAPSKRKRGERTFWSPQAKMRLYLIAASCVKAGGPYREVYDQRREETSERAHDTPCVRCGPSGKPAQPGTPWSAGHQHADALRIMGKEILRDLWDEARRLHTIG